MPTMNNLKTAYLKTGMARAQASAKRTEMRIEVARKKLGIEVPKLAEKKVAMFYPKKYSK